MSNISNKKRFDHTEDDLLNSKSAAYNSKRVAAIDYNQISSQEVSTKNNYILYEKSNNPFHDAELAKPFHWKLKDPEKKTETEEEIELRRERTLRELNELKKSREEREIQRELYEKEKAELARERENEYATAYQNEEDQFLLAQLKMRALNRFTDKANRPRVIDLMYLIYSVYSKIWISENNFEEPKSTSSLEHQVSSIEAGIVMPSNIPSPIGFIDKIDSLDNLIQLARDIRLFYKIETERFLNRVTEIKPKTLLCSSYWSALLVLVEEQAELVDPKISNPNQNVILAEIKSQINRFLKEKSIQDLKELESNIKLVLEIDAIIDAEYWQIMLKLCKYFQALAHVRDIHNLVINHIKYINQKNDTSISGNKNTSNNNNNNNLNIINSENNELSSNNIASKAHILIPHNLDVDIDISDSLISNDSSKNNFDKNNEIKSITDDTNISYNSLLGKVDVTDDTFLDILYQKAGIKKDKEYLDENELYRLEKARGMDANEETFGFEGEEVPVETDLQKMIQKSGLQDRFLPRKPKFFNRIKTGYEWTKYNQVHYDFDNPPPKVVQGYRFTIFYPDLINHKKPPGYVIELSDSPDFVILRFKSGPPYLDIAFKIVNKEWSLSQKHGFKCVFARGVLHLWFNFKKLRYRR